jgi:nascent polypeptide-associated complex subunit alpha
MAEFADPEDPRVEQLPDVDSDDDDVPELVEDKKEVTAEEEKGTTRGEKKARKAIAKLGLKVIPGVERVTMKKSKNMMFVVSRPDVFKSPTANSFIVFGEAKIEDLKQKEAMLAAQQAAAQQRAGAAGAAPQPTASIPTPSAASTAAAADEEPVDESGVDPKDIELVVSQAGCTRGAAVKALKNNDNDIVNAIMELTM